MKLKKYYLIRLLLFSIFLLGVSFYNNIDAKAYVGQQFIDAPEEGWTRYDNTDSLIKYSGIFSEKELSYCPSKKVGDSLWTHLKYENTKDYKGTYSSSSYEGASFKFTVNGSKFRLIGSVSSYSLYYPNRTNYMYVFIDGKKIGTWNNGQGTYSNCQAVTYEYSFNNPGIHTVEFVMDEWNRENDEYAMFQHLDAIDVLGNLVDNKSQIKEKLNPVLQVEQPVIGKVYTNTLPISGYALNQSGVKNVTTTIDGQLKNDCTIGQKRSDAGTISSKYPGYPNTANSGYSTNYQLKDIALGWHTLVIEATGNDGTKVSKTLYLYVWENGQTKTVEVKPEEQKNQLIPLYRYCLANTSTHFYTTSDQEVANGKYGYCDEGVAGYGYATQVTGTVPLHRFCRYSDATHIYTTNVNEIRKLQGQSNLYRDEGVQIYIYKNQVSGTLPLYSYKRSDGVYFYTCNWNELKNGALDYTYQGIEGYMKTSK